MPIAYGYVGHSDADYTVVKCQNQALVVEAMVALMLIGGECVLLISTTKQSDESALLSIHQFAVLVTTQIGRNLIILPRTSLQMYVLRTTIDFTGKTESTQRIVLEYVGC